VFYFLINGYIEQRCVTSRYMPIQSLTSLFLLICL